MKAYRDAMFVWPRVSSPNLSHEFRLSGIASLHFKLPVEVNFGSCRSNMTPSLYVVHIEFFYALKNMFTL
jgi:hypothetical protein